jgi:hypothetical protein
MRKIMFFWVLIMWSQFVTAQTVIPSSTTVQQLSLMKVGAYQFTIKGISAPDTVVDFSKDTVIIIRVDTVPRVCPPPIICPVCPVCPVIPPQRIAVKFSYDGTKFTIYYNDGTTTTL